MTSLEQAAKALLQKIEAIHNDPEYMAVWHCAQMHRGPYRGAKYAGEIDTLRDALESQPEPVKLARYEAALREIRRHSLLDEHRSAAIAREALEEKS